MLTQSELQWLEERENKCYFCESYKKDKCFLWKTYDKERIPINLRTGKCRYFSQRYDCSESFGNYERFIGCVIENLARQTPNPFEALKKAHIEAEEM